MGLNNLGQFLFRKLVQSPPSPPGTVTTTLLLYSNLTNFAKPHLARRILSPHFCYSPPRFPKSDPARPANVRNSNSLVETVSAPFSGVFDFFFFGCYTKVTTEKLVRCTTPHVTFAHCKHGSYYPWQSNVVSLPYLSITF